MRHGPFSKLFCQNLRPSRSAAEIPACLQRGAITASVFRRGSIPPPHPYSAPVIFLSNPGKNPAIPASAATLPNKFIILIRSSPYIYSASTKKRPEKSFFFVIVSSLPYSATTTPHKFIIVPISSHYKYSAATPDNISPFPAASVLTKISASCIITKISGCGGTGRRAGFRCLSP